MRKTKTNKAIAIAAVGALALTTLGSAGMTYASQIGTGSVVGDASFDSAIIWDDAFPGTATGTVSDILVKARVLPTLNMAISTGTIDLGTLTAGEESTGSLDIEIGTNAANGVNITARSGSGGLTNISNNDLQINDLTDDGVAESYKFSSTANANDSDITGFDNTGGDLAATEIDNNTTEHSIYTSNKPEKDDNTNADVTFTVSATSDAQTAAGDYQDQITFTVVGNF